MLMTLKKNEILFFISQEDSFDFNTLNRLQKGVLNLNVGQVPHLRFE